ncbi:transposase [Spirosoma foliorum]
MLVCMEVRLSGHSAYWLQYHVVWICKYRRRVLKPGIRVYLHKLLLGFCEVCQPWSWRRSGLSPITSIW